MSCPMRLRESAGAPARFCVRVLEQFNEPWDGGVGLLPDPAQGRGSERAHLVIVQHFNELPDRRLGLRPYLHECLGRRLADLRVLIVLRFNELGHGTCADLGQGKTSRPRGRRHPHS